MDQFQERLSQLADMDDAELSGLEDELVQAFDEADQAGDIDTMSQLADAIDQVRAERDRRGGSDEVESPAEDMAPGEETPEEMMAASAATAEAETTEVEETVEETDAAEPAAVSDEPTTTDTTEGDTEEPAAEAEASTEEPAADEPEDSTETEPADEAETPTVKVKAEPAPTSEEESMDAELSADGVPAENQPDLEPEAPVAVIRAGGDIPGFSAGTEMADLDEVAEAMTARINSIRSMSGGGGEQLVVASIETALEDEDRTLRMSDSAGNGRKIRKVIEQMRDPETPLTAAANGWCAPRTPIYSLFGVGESNRPVKDSLPGFNADRGGIVYTTPPALADGNYGAGLWAYVSGEGAGWFSASDPVSGAPEGATKVIFDATCPAELTADLEAITSWLRFTNPMARAFPELVRRNMELAAIAHSRFAESRLLRAMWNAGTGLNIAPTVSTGITRDLLLVLRSIAASLRNRHRTSPDQMVDIWAPAWLGDAIANDLTLGESEAGQLTVARSEVDGWLRNVKINPTWYVDDVPGNGTSQYFADEYTFPTNAAIIAALPGSFMFLDGGTLDLGVVRDSTLVGTNQYVEFSETFEQVAFMGLESASITLPVQVIGASADYVDTSAGVVVA